MSRPILLVAALTLGVLGSAAGTAAVSAEGWTIGPIIRGKNYSVGMPLYPEPTPRGWAFDFPAPRQGHVHYVTLDGGPISRDARITIRYRVSATRGARFVAQETPEQPATVSLYFQRAGDSWKMRTHEFHRWYAPPATVRALAAGEGTISIRFDDPNWISVAGRPAADHPQAFLAALRDAERVGIVFGSASARGHGVFATAPARFELLDFAIR
jgi:hypothetical protein